MSKTRTLSGTFCAVVAIPVLISSSQPWATILVHPVVSVVLALILVACGVWGLWGSLVTYCLRLTRGVTAVASDRSRREQFSQPWEDARSTIWTWGVGMTSLSRDGQVIRETIGRGVRIVIEVTDADWVRMRPDVQAMIDTTYGRKNFVEQMEDSTARLVAIARAAHREYGVDSIQVWAVQAFIPQSGTIADARTARAWGWVEWHTFGFPHGQTRLRLRNYRHRSKLNPSLLTHLLLARESVPRSRIDTESTEQAQEGSGGHIDAP